MKKEKQVGLRRSRDKAIIPDPNILLEAEQWLKTVQQIRRTGKVCKRGLYRFGTFEEADQWMEAMILSSSQESQR
jgi:predicted xylose isomerase-like sugar epimerase